MDTNVIISAVLIRGGNEDRILRAWRQGAFELVLSPQILNEIARVLLYGKIRKVRWMSEQEVTFLLETMTEESLFMQGRLKISACRDSDDNKFLEAAVEGRAQYLVSGDKDLLDLKSFRGVKMVKPSEFLRLLRGA